ncbi:hypothetical protein [Derxia gummosa]|uniref:Roadblock/LC7 domain-containing protein n=1 Tax=Derxia gummosa DSM 723 TaxID=1121388 RepID=A0A8B6X768_9BURK|nr:hypothetical protein [Derxia gummosa]
MATINESLQGLLKTDGALCAALVDYGSGMMLGSAGSGLDLELAAAGNTEVMRAKMKTMELLRIDDQIEDFLITLGRQYHLLRPVVAKKGVFMYFVLDRARANLALARRALVDAESALTF